MEKKGTQKLTLDQQVTYQITVPGIFDTSLAEWFDDLSVSVGSDVKGLPVTALTGKFDQASLHGLLRRFYSFGIPLLSIICLDFDCKPEEDETDESNQLSLGNTDIP